MVQVAGNFSQLVDLDPVLEEIFFQQYEQFPMRLVPTIYGYRTSTKAKETNLRVGSFGDPQPFDGQVAYDTAEADYEIEFVHGHLTKGFKIERTMLEDMQYDGIFDRADNLAQSFARKRVKDEASVFENAFSSAAANLGYDGVALCSASHPRSQSDSTNVSNYFGTKALTADNLESARIQLETLGDDKGEETNAMATVLVCGRQQRKTAMELVGSELQPESANNAINVHTDLSYIVHPFITGKKWFVVDGPMAQQVLKWYDRIPVQFNSADDTVNTLVRSYVGRTRYSFGWADFRFVVGSNPS